MKKVFSFILATAIVTISAAQEIVNDANAEKRNVTSFHGIQVSNAFDVYLTQGNEDAVAVSASEVKFRDKINTEVKNGILYISYENGLHFNSGKMKLKAYVSFKNLDDIKAGGACDLFVVGKINTDELRINLSGASDMKEGELNVKKLMVSLSGASDMKISGNTAQLKIDASGASDFKAYNLITDFCDAEASGASSIQITVNKELSVKASGASDVHYKGEAIIRELKTGGASSVSKKS
ncbi:MAG: DUF2807 domain-containing protein [Bacteroidetes bacterium]|nr:DUF2807 domain-containing protein [Bacteroidota bacterium]MBS1932258.1 DUF2807 domain-containing protein [Bacteroidota bacterium]